MKPEFERADPAALAAFDPRTKACTMNCGPSFDDPRSPEERRLLCPDCETVKVPRQQDFDWADKQLPAGITRQDVCIWTQDSDGPWNTSCGVTWEYNDGGPAENKAHFCHHCGGVLLADPFADDDAQPNKGNDWPPLKDAPVPESEASKNAAGQVPGVSDAPVNPISSSPDPAAPPQPEAPTPRTDAAIAKVRSRTFPINCDFVCAEDMAKLERELAWRKKLARDQADLLEKLSASSAHDAPTPRTDAMPWIPNERFQHSDDEDMNRFIRKKEVKALERELAEVKRNAGQIIANLAADAPLSASAAPEAARQLHQEAQSFLHPMAMGLPEVKTFAHKVARYLEATALSSSAEPVAWRREWEGDVSDIGNMIYVDSAEERDEPVDRWEPLYLTPQPAPPPMTKEEKEKADAEFIARIHEVASLSATEASKP